MTDSHIYSVAQIKPFLKVDQAIKFKAVSKKEQYKWIDEVLTKFKYFSLRKKDKGIALGYIIKITGLSQSQAFRIIARKRKVGKAFYKTTGRHKFPRKYGPKDIALLIKTDNAHQRLSGQATKAILKREFGTFHQQEYQQIAQISVAHIYNLRATRQYQFYGLIVKKSKSRQVPIGERKKPEPYGQLGFLRVDTVHQGDYGKKKGIYHIKSHNMI